MDWTRTTIVLFAVALAPLPAHGLDGQQALTDAQEEDSGDKDNDGAANEGRRTLDRLGKNLARGTVGVFSAHNLVPLLAGAAAAGLSTRLDGELAQPDGKQSVFGKFFDTFGNPILVGIASVAALGAGRLARVQPFRDASYDLFVATTVNYLYTGALKLATNRTRPDGSDRVSFPSGHTSAMFAWATVLERHYGMPVGVPVYFVASLVGASRIEGGSHFLSDVVAGAAIGFIVGRTVVRQNDAPLEAPRFSLQPAVGPSGQRGLIAVIRF